MRKINRLSIQIIYKNSTQQSLRLPSFHHFPFHPSIYKYLEAQNIHTPTFCQYAFFSALTKAPQEPFHITAPTGSGKTLSYLLPIASQLKHQQQGSGALTIQQRPRAIVITATKQLVMQCRQVGKQISHHAKLKVEGLGIGRTLFEENNSIKNGVDILITSNVKLQRQLEDKNLYLSNLKWLVIDETDTLFETVKLQKILKNIVSRAANISNPPKIVFSGTTNPKDLRELLKKQLGDYSEIVDKKTHMNLENIKHQFVQCQQLDKHQTLLDVLYQRRNAKTLIFCSSIRSLHELEYFLESEGIKSLSLHSQLQKTIRLQNYSLFRDGQNKLLISTDLGARGLDIPQLERVINYDFPKSTVDYLQRAGRTGRAGKSGQVVTLYHKKNLSLISQLKDASFNTPLRVTNSAYRIPNKQSQRNQNKSKR